MLVRSVTGVSEIYYMLARSVTGVSEVYYRC